MRGKCRGGVLLELRNQAGVFTAGDRSSATRTRAWDERPLLLSLCEIAIHRTAVQAKPRRDRRD
jgi:hypothetical protein